MPTLNQLRKELMVIEQAMIVWPKREDYKKHYKKVKNKYEQKLRLNRIHVRQSQYGDRTWD